MGETFVPDGVDGVRALDQGGGPADPTDHMPGDVTSRPRIAGRDQGPLVLLHLPEHILEPVECSAEGTCAAGHEPIPTAFGLGPCREPRPRPTASRSTLECSKSAGKL